MMLGAQSSVTGVGLVTTRRPISNLLSSYSSSFLQLKFNRQRHRSILICCNKSNSSSDRDYIEASVLISETIRHHRMRIHGFQEEIKWQSSTNLFPFRSPRADTNLIGSGLLRRFQSPTVFLTISCDGDFLLPIIVGEFAVEMLIQSSLEDEIVDCPNHFQLVRHIVCKLGYEVKMVRITERVVNTYFARIFFHKPGQRDILEVDVRPSDAINVAQRCGVPIYVNKQIVLMDAIRIAYGLGRMRDAKSIYDVTLDSAADGPDILVEELEMVKNLNLAIEQGRYDDAAMWRDKLLKHRDSSYEL